MNSLHVIFPYKQDGAWMFDDQARGLLREPFVMGIDTMLDEVTMNIPKAETGFKAVFSAAQFPGATFKLEWRREESGGNWYFLPGYKIEGWLCPALLKYFNKAPAQIWVRVEPRK